MPDASAGTFASEAAQLERVLRKAGAIALKMFRADVRHWIKNVSSPVSEADIAVNDLIRKELSYFGDAWLSEESEDDDARLSAGRVWVVDPIDGTRAFIAGREDWCLSAALVVDGRPVLGAIFAPAFDQFFRAEAGRGATLNGRRIAVNAHPAPGAALIGGPRPLLESLDLAALGATAAPRLGSLALRLVRVAEGALDAAIASANSHDWDLAAADILVHEAGGVLTTTAGEKIQYNQPSGRHGVLVAGGESLHRQLLGRLAPDRADV